MYTIEKNNLYIYSRYNLYMYFNTLKWNKYLYFGLHSFVEYLLIVTPEIIFDRENRIRKQNQKPARHVSNL